MAGASQALVLRFRTDLAGAQRDIASFATQAATSLVSLGTTAVSAQKNLQVLNNSGIVETVRSIGALNALKIAGGVYLGFTALSFAFRTMSEAAEEAEKRLASLVAIATSAGSAGVNTSFFQVWAGQAKELNVEAQKLVGMLDRAREASTVRIGEGTNGASSTMLNRLKQNVLAGNISAGDRSAFASASSQEGRIRVVLDLLEKMIGQGRTLAALDLANTMFGPEFEKQLRGGVDMIGKMRDAMKETSVAGGNRIIPPEEIETAQRIKGKIEEINNLLEKGMKPINEDIVRWSQHELETWTDLKLQLAGWVVKLGEAYEWASKISHVMAEIGNADVFKNFNDWYNQSELKKLYDQIPSIGPEVTLLGEKQDYPQMPAEIADGAPAITVRGDKSNSLPSHSKAPTKSDLDSIDNYVNQLQRSAVALKAEAENYSKSNAEKLIAINLAKAEEMARQKETELTAKQRQDIIQASEDTIKYKNAISDLEQRQRQAAEAARYFGQIASDALADMIIDGKSAADVFSSMTKMLEKAAIQAALLGTGPLSGLLGTAPAASEGSNATGGLLGLFSGLLKFAGGGEIAGPGSGTSDSILMWGSAGEFMVNAESTRKFRPVLEAINSGHLGRYASGGAIGSLSSFSPGSYGGCGGDVAVNVYNSTNSQVEPQQSEGPDGLKQIALYVTDHIVSDLSRNGPIAKNLQNGYGLNRAAGRR
jgi:hypothetical protein